MKPKTISVKEIDKIEIAGKLTIGDWEKIEFTVGVDWDKAFQFFEERITTRYLEPISVIRQMNNINGEGFAMVNLQCSLIETIESFYNGWIYQPYNDNKTGLKKGYYEKNLKGNPISGKTNQSIFKSFFQNREPFKGLIKGNEFYQNVRCGLLHETQTKNGWIIHADSNESEMFFKKDGDKKILYRNNFQDALKSLIDNYKKAIISGEKFGDKTTEELRENFIAKFNHICELSKP